MGIFPTLAASYVIFALIFQTLAVGFVSLDGRCNSKRMGWAILILLTGPIGLFIYLFKGRR